MTYGTHQLEIEEAEKALLAEEAEERHTIDDYWRDTAQQARRLESLAAKAPAGGPIYKECLDIAEFLIGKNIAYGNSALSPIGIFSSTTAREQIAIRIDDKLNRLKNGKNYPGDDNILDLIGYLVLYRLTSK